VKEADACQASGKALLRREGIYSSHLSSWRMQLGVHGAVGLTAKKPGRKPRLWADVGGLKKIPTEGASDDAPRATRVLAAEPENLGRTASLHEIPRVQRR
jgi:hypothetical protein